MPNLPLKLRNGWQVYEPTVDAVNQALIQLRDYPREFISYVDWCRRERHELPVTTIRLLQGKLLLEREGKVDELVRQTVLASVGPDYEPRDPVSGAIAVANRLPNSQLNRI